jgi:oligopeptide/dipeptide ABC transporter ATP-binding protein
VSEGLAPGLRRGPDDSLLWVAGLSKSFPATGRGTRRTKPLLAVDDVSFDLTRGETLGLVGESGCGKTTIARCVLRLLEPTAGRIFVSGIDLLALTKNELRLARRRMQIVFQDPLASLDPRMSAAASVEEPLQIHGVGSKPERRARARELLELVGLPAGQHPRKPHEFSGGQRQRIAIARALALSPELLVLDEPVSALDVSIQAQVLNLLRRLQRELGLTYLFIVHDLAVAEHFCDRVAVLYRGFVMELAERESLFDDPLNPYTVALLSAVPIPDADASLRRERIVLRGEVEAPALSSFEGCPFRARCPLGRERDLCRTTPPPLREAKPGHWVACHFAGELKTTWAERENGDRLTASQRKDNLAKG